MLTEEHKANIGKGLKIWWSKHTHNRKIWNKGKTGNYSKETLDKMSNARKGTHPTKETRKKMSLFWKTHSSNVKGKHWKLSEEIKKKMGESQTKRYDKIGRKINKRYHHIINKEYEQWRSDIFERDNWTCQTCGKRGIKLQAHHIKSFALFPEIRYILENGITLCEDCHKLTDNFKNRRIK